MRADRTGRPTQHVASSGQSQTVRPALRMGAGGVVYAFVCTSVGCTTNQSNQRRILVSAMERGTGGDRCGGQPGRDGLAVDGCDSAGGGVRPAACWRRRNWLRTAAWAGAWVAGIALIVLVAVVGGLGSEAPSVGWGALELPIFATWLALGARVNRILSTPAHSRDVPETSDRSSRQASS
jgi:hypothetical protein